MILTWLLTPIGRYVAGAGVVLAIIGGLYLLGRSHGGTAAIERVEKQNTEVKRIVDKQVSNVSTCFAKGPPWEWDTSTGSCFKMENAK
jgi:hypothetical protein